MRAVDLIIKKRNGEELTAEEIHWLVKGISRGDIPDYQTSAFLMSVYFRGMSSEELAAFTEAMIHSGEVFNLADISGPKVDKHSTGGVGDKVSLILAPAAAACGVIVPMVSGRALGHTGGTLDKLEAIPGYRTTMSENEFKQQLRKIGVAIIGQSNKFVPADKKLYALRDLTGTIDSIPLISASIMSKKIASGTEALVMDVKTGNGAFMSDFDRALELAKTLVKLGYSLDRPTMALITDMNQPLGKAVGNSLEVIECIETMKGKAPNDLLEITCVLGAYMLLLAKIADDYESARQKMQEVITNGAALDKLRQLIESQGGNPHIIDDYSLLNVSPQIARFCAEKSGYITSIDTLQVGIASMVLGAGRNRLEDTIDYGVGLIFRKKIGDYVDIGEPIFDIYYRSNEKLELAKNLLTKSIIISDRQSALPALIKAIIDKNSVKILSR